VSSFNKLSGLLSLLLVLILSQNAAFSAVLETMDSSANPCVDFYQYACGGWIKTHPLPQDTAFYGRISEVQERNLKILNEILEKSSGPIGRYHASCMDEEKINRLGISPIQSTLDRIAGLKSKTQLGSLIASLHKENYPVFFSFSSQRDLTNALKTIAVVDQGGTRLNSASYFDKNLVEKYVKHIEKMFILSGIDRAKSAVQAQAALAIETALAKSSQTLNERRYPQNIYDIKSVVELKKMAPFMDWSDYLQRVKAPAFKTLNVAAVKFVKVLNETVQKSSLDDLKAYLRWSVLAQSAPLLSKEFAKEHFDFFHRTLLGQNVMPPRWLRCTRLVDAHLGDALGQAFVEKVFDADRNARIHALVDDIRKALAKDIDELPWMVEATKQQALLKLAAIGGNVGYPDKRLTSSNVRIESGEFFRNSARAESFEFQRQVAKIGKPTDKGAWQITPPTVSPYFDSQANSLNIPAGILQPPFFDGADDNALNYGSIGTVIGHELIHGFDSRGRLFDAHGGLSEWWTPHDVRAYNQQEECFVNQYRAYSRENSGLTLVENIADNGGVRLAWDAFMEGGSGETLAALNGLTQAQRFFLGFAQGLCSNQEPDAADTLAMPHSSAKIRVNGALSNMAEFAKTFSCQAGQPMAPQKRCRIW
jgi:putative endopeptidase